MTTKKILGILLNAFPVLVMVALIPYIHDDYFLALIFLVIAICSIVAGGKKHDITAFVFGFLTMTFFEYLFVNTEVEMFTRRTLFGVMPLWLPFLWGYGFVAMKRALNILNS